MDPTARFFLCARCLTQVLVCQRCDRGQIYCGAHCAHQTRQQRQREANRRYAKTRNARHKNALRQQRYRQRQRAHSSPNEKKVTDQGSTPVARGDNFVHEPISQPKKRLDAQKPMSSLCVVCGSRCSALVRHDFLSSHRHSRHRCQPKHGIP